jgi:hypothetical protein
MTVPQDHRAPGADVVDESLSVFAFKPGARGALEENGIAANTGKCSNGGVYTAGDNIAGIG